MEQYDGLAVTACQRCPALVESRSQIVNGAGPETAAILFVGEGPGATEDERGEPFVGRSGTVLESGLETVGIDREHVRITNCVRCRPPDNRDPTKDELANCRDHLEREIEHLDPDVIVTLGKVPSEHLLDRSVAVTTEAGAVETVRIDGTPRQLVICLHPAATLYDRSQEDSFTAALETVATLSDIDSNGDGQSTLDGF